ncbi:MAG TPA: hypothetical protein VD967_00930 [Candidatus Paceibacterota bacterium]|nr:hypothetical protein [Candidatus Paceibacterota bacterium]
MAIVHGGRTDFPQIAWEVIGRLSYARSLPLRRKKELVKEIAAECGRRNARPVDELKFPPPIGPDDWEMWKGANYHELSPDGEPVMAE